LFPHIASILPNPELPVQHVENKPRYGSVGYNVFPVDILKIVEAIVIERMILMQFAGIKKIKMSFSQRKFIMDSLPK